MVATGQIHFNFVPNTKQSLAPPTYTIFSPPFCSHLLPALFVVLYLRCVVDGTVVVADGQVFVVLLTELDQQVIILELQILFSEGWVVVGRGGEKRGEVGMGGEGRGGEGRDGERWGGEGRGGELM